jgi:MFS family permease
MTSEYSLLANLKSLPRPVWILFAGTFVNRFGTFVMPFLVIYLTRQGYSGAQAGIAVSAYGAGHLIASLLGGHLADRFGRRNTIALSMFASTAAMIGLSQARAYPTILIVTLLAGMAAELYRPAAGALIGDLVPQDQRITAFGVYRLAINLGFAFGPATAGFLATRSFLILFIIDAATSFVFGVVALFALPHGTRGRTAGERTGAGFRHALSNRPFVLFLLATLCVTWIEFQIHSTFPLLLQAQGFSIKIYGLLMSLNGVLIVLFELAITGWTQRFPPRRIIALGYALSAFGFAMSGLAHSVTALAATVMVWTIGEMIYAPVTGAYVTNLAPEQYRGRYHGMWTMTWSIGMLLGPSLGTLLFERNAPVYWTTIAVVGTLGAGLALVKTRGAGEDTRASI